MTVYTESFWWHERKQTVVSEGFYEFQLTSGAALLMALAHHYSNLEEVISDSACASAQPIKAPESRGSLCGPSACSYLQPQSEGASFTGQIKPIAEQVVKQEIMNSIKFFSGERGVWWMC